MASRRASSPLLVRSTGRPYGLCGAVPSDQYVAWSYAWANGRANVVPATAPIADGSSVEGSL